MAVDEDLNAATIKIYEAKGYEFKDHAMETGCTFKVSAEIPAIDYVEGTGEKARLMTMGTRVTISTMGIPRIQAREEVLTADIRFGELTCGEHRMIGDHVDLPLFELNDKINNCLSKGYIVIEFHEKGPAKYKVGVRALGATVDRLYRRIATLASEKRWAKTSQPDQSVWDGGELNMTG